MFAGAVAVHMRVIMRCDVDMQQEWSALTLPRECAAHAPASVVLIKLCQAVCVRELEEDSEQCGEAQEARFGGRQGVEASRA